MLHTQKARHRGQFSCKRTCRHRTRQTQTEEVDQLESRARLDEVDVMERTLAALVVQEQALLQTSLPPPPSYQPPLTEDAVGHGDASSALIISSQLGDAISSDTAESQPATARCREDKGSQHTGDSERLEMQRWIAVLEEVHARTVSEKSDLLYQLYAAQGAVRQQADDRPRHDATAQTNIATLESTFLKQQRLEDLDTADAEHPGRAGKRETGTLDSQYCSTTGAGNDWCPDAAFVTAAAVEDNVGLPSAHVSKVNNQVEESREHTTSHDAGRDISPCLRGELNAVAGISAPVSPSGPSQARQTKDAGSAGDGHFSRFAPNHVCQGLQTPAVGDGTDSDGCRPSAIALEHTEHTFPLPPHLDVPNQATSRQVRFLQPALSNLQH
jgi:hypothetical protein